MTVYRTKLADIYLHDCGWIDLADGTRIHKLPPLDHAGADGRGMARGEAIGPWLQARGFALADTDEIRALNRHPGALYISPTIIAVNPSNAHLMASREWCLRHDREAWAKIEAAGWDGSTAIPGFGKPQAGDDPSTPQDESGRMGEGWDRDSGPGVNPIQGESDAHIGYVQIDYATSRRAVDRRSKRASTDRDVKPANVPQPSKPGDTGRAVKDWQLFLMEYFKERGEKALPKYGADGIHGASPTSETTVWAQRWREAQKAPDTEPPLAAGLDLSTIPFVQAKAYGGRRRESILGVCIHVSQNTEHPSGAEILQATAARGGKVSWGYALDNNSITQSVRDEDISFTAGPGNDRWIHIEFFGRVEQGAAGWADAFSTAQLALGARLVAALLRKHHCPVERVRAEGLLQSAQKGVTGHEDFSAACVLAKARDLRIAPWWDGTRNSRGYPDNWRSTNHSDPGASFPWSAFMAAVAVS